MDQKMFCYQCQETAGCKGCTMSGVCSPSVPVWNVVCSGEVVLFFSGSCVVGFVCVVGGVLPCLAENVSKSIGVGV